MPVLPSYRETSQLICMANQLTGFYKRETLAPNGLSWNLVSRAFRICKIRRYFFCFCCCYFFYYYSVVVIFFIIIIFFVIIFILFYFIFSFFILFILFYFFIFYFYFFILFFLTFIWHFDVTWLISQQFIRRDLKPAAFLINFKIDRLNKLATPVFLWLTLKSIALKNWLIV